LKPGQKLCSKCYKRYDNGADEEMDLSDVEYQAPREMTLDTLRKTSHSLDCTPIKTSVGRRDRLSYGKRKVKQLQAAVKAKCAHALDLPKGDLDSTEDSDACDHCRDLEIFVTLVKEKIKMVTRQEKIKLLTLTPESWTIKKTIEEFGVTEHLVKHARQIKREKGLLADPDPNRGRALPQEISERILDFYQLDEYSRMCPGKKECVAVKKQNVKEYKQKLLLLINLKELYAEYTKRNPNDKIGFSKFCELRPKWVIPVTASGMHSVCVCQQHQNAKLLTAALPGKYDYKDILGKLICSLDKRDCMLHLCNSCPGKTVLQDYLTDLFTSQDFDFDDNIVYKQWLHTDRTTIVTLTTPIQEFIQLTTDAFDSLLHHHFIAKAQSSYLSKIKESLAPDAVIVLLDFAENYSFIVQDAVQGYHWNNLQATLHPFVVYYRSEGELKCLNICIISDCLKHDTVTVHSFVSTMLTHLKTVLPFIQKIIYISVMEQHHSTKTIIFLQISAITNLTMDLKLNGTSSELVMGRAHVMGSEEQLNV
jgi:hypothetical protein